MRNKDLVSTRQAAPKCTRGGGYHIQRYTTLSRGRYEREREWCLVLWWYTREMSYMNERRRAHRGGGHTL